MLALHVGFMDTDMTKHVDAPKAAPSDVAAQALDVQQRFLEQNELRLNFNIEAARRSEQLHQHLGERNLLQRAIEDRLADDANLAFQLVDARVRRNPTGLDVRGRDAVVIPAKKR